MNISEESPAVRRSFKCFAALMLIAALACSMLAVIWAAEQEDSYATVSKAAVRKAKKYRKSANKLFKVGSSWYCFSKRRVKKGLQKVGSKYYYFSKSTGKMHVKTGLKKVGTSYYYFKVSKGKAPAYKNKAWKDGDGKVWFFRSTGKRYGYSYKDTGSTSGNTAAGYIISSAGIKLADKATTAQLQAAYKKIVSRSKSLSIDATPITSSGVIGSYALTAAKKKGGKCYHMAALTFVTFKALGENASLVTGKCDKQNGKGQINHAWVENSKLVYDSMFDLSKKEMAFMGKEMDALHGPEYKNKEFKLLSVPTEYANYIYTPDQKNTFK